MKAVNILWIKDGLQMDCKSSATHGDQPISVKQQTYQIIHNISKLKPFLSEYINYY